MDDNTDQLTKRPTGVEFVREIETKISEQDSSLIKMDDNTDQLTKHSTGVEFVRELETKISEQVSSLIKMDDNTDQQTKHNASEELSEKLEKPSDLQNDQSKSKMPSVELEKQTDKLESEKKELITEKEKLQRENISFIHELADLILQGIYEFETDQKGAMANIEKLLLVQADRYKPLVDHIELLYNILEDMKRQNNTFEEKIKDFNSENEELRQFDNKNVKSVSGNNINFFKIQFLLKKIKEYKSLFEKQEEKMNQLIVHLGAQDFIDTNKFELGVKLSSLQLQYDNVLAENDKLICKIGEQSEIADKKKQIEDALIAIHEQIDEFEKLMNISARKNDEAHSNDEVSHINSVIVIENKENYSNVENVNKISNQLEAVEESLSQNIEQTNEHPERLENNPTITSLQKRIKELNMKVFETKQLLKAKDVELRITQKEKLGKSISLALLNEILQLKNNTYYQIDNDWREKYSNLEKQLISNVSMESKILELENENKLQHKKMKKLAAHLRKKSQALRNLRGKYRKESKKWEAEKKEQETLKQEVEKNALLEKEINVLNEKLNSSYQEVENQLVQAQELKEELCDYKQKIAALINTNKKLSEEISGLNVKFEDAHNKFDGFEKRVSALSSDNQLKKADEHNNLNIETNENKVETVLGEEMHLTESLETTEIKLGEQLQEKTDKCKEVPETEDLSAVNTLDSDTENMKSNYEQKLRAFKEDNENMMAELQNQLELCEKVSQSLVEINKKMVNQITNYANQCETSS